MRENFFFTPIQYSSHLQSISPSDFVQDHVGPSVTGNYFSSEALLLTQSKSSRGLNISFYMLLLFSKMNEVETHQHKI